MDLVWHHAPQASRPRLGRLPVHVSRRGPPESLRVPQTRRSGGDPATLRRNTAAPSFAEACERVIEMRAPSLKDGGKSANNWRSTLGRFASPRLADMLVSEITSEDVLAVLLPVWTTRRATPITPPAASPRGSSSRPSPCSSPCVRLKPPTEQEFVTRDSGNQSTSRQGQRQHQRDTPVRRLDHRSRRLTPAQHPTPRPRNAGAVRQAPPDHDGPDERPKGDARSNGPRRRPDGHGRHPWVQ